MADVSEEPEALGDRLLDGGFLGSEDFFSEAPSRTYRKDDLILSASVGAVGPSGQTPFSAPEGYELLELLGEGGMGAVHRARELSTGREVALKFLLGLSLRAVERFLREGVTLAALDHPGIVRVYSQGMHRGRPFLALELVEGGRTLRELFKTAPLAVRIGLVREVAAAVGHAHAAGVVHRDLKPSNVLVTPLGQPKVCDFGLARKADLETLTRTGAVLGTPSYMSPEQITGKGHEAGPAADVWALGVMLYEAITRARPTPVTELEPSVSPALAAVVERALAQRPDERYADAREFAAALSAAGDASGGLQRWRLALRRPLWRRAVLALVFSTCGLGGLGLLSSWAQRPPASADGPPAAQRRVPVLLLQRALARRDYPAVIAETDDLELSEATHDALALRGWALLRGRGADAARPLAEALLEARPAGADGLALFALCLAPEDPRRLPLVARALDSRPRSGYLASLHARLVGTEDPARAHGLWRAALELPVESWHRASTGRHRGLQALALGEDTVAVDCLERALRYRDAADLRMKLVEAQLRLDRTPDARRGLRRLIESGEDPVEAPKLLARLLERSDERGAALEVLRSGVGRHAQSWELHYRLGDMLFRATREDLPPEAFERRYEDARAALVRALALEPPAATRAEVEGRLNDARNMTEALPRITDSLLEPDPEAPPK